MRDDGGMRMPAWLSGRLGPLEERQFRLFWTGQATSAVGDSLVPIAMVFAVLRLGGGPGGIGLVLASITLPRVLLLLVGGVWADRLPRQLVMVGADVARGTVNVIFAVLLLTGHAQLWHLVVGAAVIGAASAFFVPATTGLIPETVSPGRLQQANALMSLSRNSSQIIAPSVSGLMVATIGSGWVFAVDAATFAVSAISLLALRLPYQVRPAPGGGFLAELAGGWHEVASRRWLLASIVTFGISNVGMAPVFVLGPVIASQRLGGATNWGLFVTSLGIGGLLGGLLALRWRPRHPLATGFALSIAIALPALALAPPLGLPLIILAGVLTFAVIELGNTWWYTVLQQQVPPEALSRVSSYDWLASLVFQPLGFAVVGPVALLIGAAPTLYAGAALNVLANLGVLSIPAVRQLTMREHESHEAGSEGQRIEPGPVAGPVELE
jgi:MFS family permease